MTKHCELRIRERMNLPKSAAEKLVFNAFNYGKSAFGLPARERAYMLSKERNGMTTRYYSGCCFIFSSSTQCITMYHVPGWFLSKSNYNGKDKIKNPKKYFTRYYIYEEYDIDLS